MGSLFKKVWDSATFSDKDYLAPSPYQEDRNFLIGRLPREISIEALRGLGNPESPIKAIRAKCIDCSGGNMAEARKCVAYACPLWAFRMGHNPFWGQAEDGAEA